MTPFAGERRTPFLLISKCVVDIFVQAFSGCLLVSMIRIHIY